MGLFNQEEERAILVANVQQQSDWLEKRPTLKHGDDPRLTFIKNKDLSLEIYVKYSDKNEALEPECPRTFYCVRGENDI